MGKASWNSHRVMATGPGTKLRHRLAIWLGTLLCLAVAACAPIYSDHGYVPTELELAQITVGKDTHETVAAAIGRPSATGLLNDTGWYYVQSRWKSLGARAPKEIDRQVVAITFTPAGVVANVERFGLERGQVIALSRRVTDSNIKGIGIIRQLMGSLGRVTAGDLLRK